MKIKFSLVFLICLLSVFSVFGQNEIFRPCPGIKDVARVTIDKAGNVNLVPCPGKTYLFNGQPLNLNAIGQLNGLNGYSQTFAFGTAGSTPGWISSGTTHTLNIPIASGTNTGLLTPAMFNKYETASSGYVGLSNYSLPLWNGTTFNNSQFSQSGAGYAQTLRVNGQTIVLGDALAAGNNRTVTISDIASNTLAVVGNSNINGNLTVSGTISANSFSFTNQTANQILASPSSGSGAPSFRSLVASDIPSLDAAKISTGIFDIARIPDFAAAKITTGTIAPARLGSGTANNTTILYGDGSWGIPNRYLNVGNCPSTLTASNSGIVCYASNAVTLPTTPPNGTNFTLYENVGFSRSIIFPVGVAVFNGKTSSTATATSYHKLTNSSVTLVYTNSGWVATSVTNDFPFMAS